MLVIRNEQMQAFAARRQNEFHAACTARWMARARDGADEKQANEIVARSVTRAFEQYGIDREGLLVRYLDFVQDLGEDFDRQPWAAEVLSDTELSAAQKMRLLEEGSPHGR